RPSPLVWCCALFRSHPHSFPPRRSSDLENLVDDLAGPLKVVAHERGGVAGQPQDPGEVLADFDPGGHRLRCRAGGGVQPERRALDRKSTRLNSSHVTTSYALFCVKKKTT